MDSYSDSTQHCALTIGANKTCHTLDDLKTLCTVNDTTVIFCSQNFKLDFNIELEGVHNIQLVGSPSTLTCSDNAGLTVVESENITVTSITFENCGVLKNSTTVDTTNNNASSVGPFRSAVYVLDSTTFTLDKVAIKNSNGVGLSFFDTSGTVEITNCTFANNRVNGNESSGGGGVYVEFTCSQRSQYSELYDCHINTADSIYRFNQCKFIDNIATSVKHFHTDFAINKDRKLHGHGRGGGLNVVFAAAHKRVVLDKCEFGNNSAIWGGGLKVAFLDEACNNSFTAQECVFYDNMCGARGGGGADVGFSSPYPRSNELMFRKCNFTNNTALFGGGLAFYSSSAAHENLSNSAMFDGCRWTHNRARFGSAVDITVHAWTLFVSGYLPYLMFKDALFFENYVVHKTYQMKEFTLEEKGSGAFLATEFTINFFGTLNFTNNNGSALFLVSSVAVFGSHTNIAFHNNSGFNGGAIAMVGFSVLIINHHMYMTLSNNSAVMCGGAIYSYSIDKHDYVSSKSCFINSENVQHNKRLLNTSIVFIHNSAGKLGYGASKFNCGHSIYATTLLPCYYECINGAESNALTIEETFKCYGNFTFADRNRSDGHEVMTSGVNFTFGNIAGPVKVIPNKKEKLPVDLVDDLHQKVDAKVFIDISAGNTSSHKIALERSYAYISDNETVIYGQPRDMICLDLTQTPVRQNAITFKIELQECPPGFINIDGKCICSVGTKSFYSPVYACDDDEFVAKARHGYWIGYVNGETEDDLMYSYCRGRRCFRDSAPQSAHKLTPNASKDDLDRLLCGTKATGILCGTCREGYSASYHSSDSGLCTNRSCRFGWLFYLVSELLPITIIFIVVITSNVNIVTGDLNGFIYFAQMFNSMSITAHDFILLSEMQAKALRIARMLYYFFNFEFFRINELSFCLWRGATNLDVLAFKYVTVAYALLLIITTIWLMNKCNLYQKISCLRASTMHSSIIHGLSAFLIMVYTQCATVSLKILDFTYLFTKGHKYNRTVVHYLGDVRHLHPQHLPYAIPALVCVITIVLTPTIVLLLYPSCFKLFTISHLEETRCVSFVLHKIPHSLLKPFTDSFQNCFKDNLRFFAGLYFVYRCLMLLSVLLLPDQTQHFILLQFLFTVMLLIHCLFQPYKQKRHNVLDALVFFNLSAINGITIYNYHFSKMDFADKKGVRHLIHVQLVLAYLPLMYVIIYTVLCLVNKIRRIRKVESLTVSIQLRKLMKRAESEEQLPSRLEMDNEVSDYQLYKEQTGANVN